ncbi:MAG: hypothetical protein B7Y26_06120 [Hydrogenophilales bacterium 16-64-46]|nr:MAG: hypothetical protein B7Z32_00500 [Hydrogenophilales bacterium 12-64-13]OYZ05896.1 MAG: hypothetical protein B7Y26_06120 [Hydrogenophilales bacterium 16-64-46]OZA39832.1 MAG: hypothetical protein B7X87_02145 [Hydrogenophilales bacterium 17-64-34]HQT00252.1 hypothetical protein [Thiobacillus sp.]
MKTALLLAALLGAGTVCAQDAPNWLSEPAPVATIRLAEPAVDEAVVVINDNALGGNHAGLFAGDRLIDPAGSYFGVRGEDKTWSGPTLADYTRYQTTDGLKVRVYRFRLSPDAMAQLRQRIADAGPTPPLFCAAAVQNLLVDLAPFDAITRTGFTTPTALGKRLDALVSNGVGECQQLDASPC